MRLIQVTYLV